MGQKRKLKGASNSQARKKHIVNSTTNKQPTTLETIFKRFPHLSEAMFGELDNQSLASCQEWNEKWKKNLESCKILWFRKLQLKRKHFYGFNKEWAQILVRIPLDLLKKLAIAARVAASNLKTCQSSPLHVAAHHGDFSLFKYTLTRMEIKNPKDDTGFTPLHMAAQLSRLEITKQILKILKDEIPRDNFGMTPHHHAALNGDLNLFKALFEHVTNKS